MSMISSLIDELRELALWLDDEFYDAEATKVRDAADIIWQLRDDLQRANAENAKLREQLVEESSERVILNDWHFEIADALGIHYEDDNDVDCNDLGENNLNEVKKTIAETNEMILVISDLMNSYADADVPHTNCHKCTASKRCSGSPCILIDDVRRRMIEIGVEV